MNNKKMNKKNIYIESFTSFSFPFIDDNVGVNVIDETTYGFNLIDGIVVAIVETFFVIYNLLNKQLKYNNKQFITHTKFQTIIMFIT